MNVRSIAFLGPVGTYSEDAAQLFAEASTHFVPCVNFDEAVSLLEEGAVSHAILPIENSTEGPVHRTLDLLAKTSTSIVGEVLLPIHHQLMSTEKDAAGINVVYSHSQSLAQCRRWLDAHLPNIERVVMQSNSAAAKHAATEKCSAAIASARAAKLYGLNVIATNIEDDAENATRFVVLGTDPTASTGNDKTSIVCASHHKPGALYDLLGIFAKRSINMTKLESRPDPHAAWKYLFFIDIEGHVDQPLIQEALGEIQESATYYKLLGSYPAV